MSGLRKPENQATARSARASGVLLVPGKCRFTLSPEGPASSCFLQPIHRESLASATFSGLDPLLMVFLSMSRADLTNPDTSLFRPGIAITTLLLRPPSKSQLLFLNPASGWCLLPTNGMGASSQFPSLTMKSSSLKGTIFEFPKEALSGVSVRGHIFPHC